MATQETGRGVAKESIGYYARRAMNGEPDEGKSLIERMSNAPFDFSTPLPAPYRRSEHAENVRHRAYETPPQWGEPSYQILFVRVGQTPEGGPLMSHSGEEILFPVSGADIVYEFFWPRDDQKLLTCSVPPSQTPGSGTAIRILPNCPHRSGTASGSTDDGYAWMVLRHLGGSTAQIGEVADDGVQADKSEGEQAGSDGIYSLEELDVEAAPDRERAAAQTRAFLLLSDIPGKLKVARTRAGCSVTQLADACNIHPSYIWKLERGDTNISIHTLEAIAKTVRLDLSNIGVPHYFGTGLQERSDFKRFQPYTYKPSNMEPLRDYSDNSGIAWKPLVQKSDEYDHWIHGHVIRIDAGIVLRLGCTNTAKKGELIEKVPSVKALDTYLGPYGRQSWIVLEGKIIFESEPNDQGIREEQTLSSRNKPVIHLRNRTKGVLRNESSEPCTLLHIEHSGYCSCDRPRIIEIPDPSFQTDK